MDSRSKKAQQGTNREERDEGYLISILRVSGFSSFGSFLTGFGVGVGFGVSFGVVDFRAVFLAVFLAGFMSGFSLSRKVPF